MKKIKVDFANRKAIKALRREKKYHKYFYRLDNKNKKEVYLVPEDKIKEIENIIFGESYVYDKE